MLAQLRFLLISLLVLVPTLVSAQSDWSLVASPTAEDLRGLYVASPTAAFAVGGSGIAVRYDGTAWTLMNFVDPVALTSVVGFSDSEVYALGGGVIYEFDGTAWATMDPPPAAEFLPATLWASPWGALYAAGSGSGTFYPGGIAKFEGAQWTYAAGSQQVSSPQVDVWGVADNSMYAASANEIRVHACPGSIGDFWGRTSIIGYGGKSIWGPGGTSSDVFVGNGADIHHWDGQGNLCTYTWPANGAANSRTVRQIWGLSGNQIFAVGNDRFFNGQIFLDVASIYEGSTANQWSRMKTPIDALDIILMDVHGADSTSVFAVGEGGTILRLQAAVPADTLVVNTTSDAPDLPGDDECDTGEPPIDGRPACSLRAAVQFANNQPGRQVIVFDIPGSAPYRILADSSIVVTDSVSIVGPEVGGPPTRISAAVGPPPPPIVVLDGSDTVDHSLILVGPECLVEGLAIVNYTSHGIAIRSSFNVVVGCYIGVSIFGGADEGNGGSGISIESGRGNLIGTRSSGNLISGNTAYGVASAASESSIQGNAIGLDLTGTGPLANGAGGILVTAFRVFIGGETPVPGTTAGNVISGNGGSGIECTGPGSSTSRILGNIIGASPDGLTKIPNVGYGVWINNGAQDIDVGGAEPGHRNVISGNTFAGVRIEGALSRYNSIENNLIGVDLVGTGALGNGGDGVSISNADSNVVGRPGHVNVISGNTKNGVAIEGAGAVGNTVEANYIGTDLPQTKAVANGLSGVSLSQGANHNHIGRGAINGRNYIAGNANGVRIDDSDTRDNTIAGNYVGVTLTRRIDNTGSGVFVSRASHNTIGGDTAAEGNVISGNTMDGVWVFGVESDSVKVLNNAIGLAPSPVFTADPANNRAGIRISGGATHTTAAYNTISNNRASGVYIFSESGGTANAAVLTNNRIGIAATTDDARPNVGQGILIENSSDNVVGADESADGNVISGNMGSGVEITGAFAMNNLVRGNKIGSTADGTGAVGNAAFGVRIAGGANKNIVGYINGEGRNIISGNMLSGVVVSGQATRENDVIGNYIGTDVTGNVPIPNEQVGVFVSDAPKNRIGSFAGGNVISGNAGDGVYIAGEQADSNQVADNLIGTDAGGGCTDDGMGACAMGNDNGISIVDRADNTRIFDNTISGNRKTAIRIEGDNRKIRDTFVGTNIVGLDSGGVAAAPNKIGISVTSAVDTRIVDNVVSGNREVGIDLLSPDTRGTEVSLNRVGVQAFAALAVPNHKGGILVDSTTRTRIDRCIVSGNNDFGIKVEGAGTDSTEIVSSSIGCDKAGLIAISNIGVGVWITRDVRNTTVGGNMFLDGNVISGNTDIGILIENGAENSRVMGNFVGATSTGTGPLPNLHGVVIRSAGRNRIGDTDRSNRNIISANKQSGIRIESSGATENEIVGNYIGTDSSGTQPLPNEGDGVVVARARNNSIGIAQPGGGNLISGNLRMGVTIDGKGEGATFGNKVQNNLIGLAVSGDGPLANRASGVYIVDAHSNFVGGVGSMARNTISGNDVHGIVLDQTDGYGQATRYNRIQDNYIGTNQAGTQPVPNIIDGIHIRFARLTVIGGKLGSEGNVISGNMGNGIKIESSGDVVPNPTSDTNNRIQGNLIGWDATGSAALPNIGDGIFLTYSHHNLIGGSTVLRNWIAHSNPSTGILLEQSGYNTVISNLVIKNGNGIELSGISASFNTITQNVITQNSCGIVGEGQTNGNILSQNTVKANTANSCTGIHLDGPGYTIIGNSITDDAGDGIALSNGADPETHQNNIVSNALFGITTDGAAAVNAQDNWWGAASGPGGVGPGSGDEVSAGVDFSNWRTEPTALVMSSATDSIVVTPGGTDSVLVLLQNWVATNDVVDITVSDSQGWVTSSSSGPVSLDDPLGGDWSVTVSPPVAATGSSRVTVQGISQANPSDTAEATFLVLTYTPELASLVLLPDTLRLAPRDTFSMVVEGYDQTGRPLTFNPVWNATGGSIDQAGVYTAPDFNGEYSVSVTDNVGAVTAETIVVVDGVEPLQLTLGILANPYFSNLLDIFVVGSQEIDPQSISLDVDGTIVPMTETDPAQSVWRADFELTGAGGVIDIDVCASSVQGSSNCVSTTISAARVVRGVGSVLTTSDAIMKIHVPGPAVLQDGYIVAVPEKSAGALSTFRVIARDMATHAGLGVEFDMSKLVLPGDVDVTRFSIVSDGVERLPTTVDPSARTIRATTHGGGIIRLELGAPGSAILADVRFASLGQAYPNPFNPTTTIPFEMSVAQYVELSIYDVAGRLVERLIDDVVPAGRNVAVWRGTTGTGGNAASGIYFVRLKTEHAVISRKLTLLK